ncbi:P-loop containing nucleoside triphosphate hydrolase protein, partial [Fusarium solani]
MMEGAIGPKELTVGPLKSHIRRRFEQGMRVFIIDGFPRNILQLHYFEVEVGAFECLIYLDCPEETLMQRLLPRGRFDDQAETIQGRLRTFNMSTSEAVEYFRGHGKLKVLNGEQTMETVHGQLKGIISEVAELRQTSEL